MKQDSNHGLKVCMFVRNYFTNDARVTREAKSLIKAGHKVWVIAVHDDKNPDLAFRETIDGINVIRIKRLGIFYRTKSRLVALRNKLLCKLTNENAYASRSMRILEPFVLLFLSFWYLVMSILCFAHFGFKLLAHVTERVTLGYARVLAAFIITTSRFVAKGHKVNADIYHSHDLNTLLAGYLCSRRNKAKLVYDSHEICTDQDNLKAKPFWRFLERILIRKADFIVFTTYTRAKFAADRYNIELPAVIGNFTDVPEKVTKIDLRKSLCLNNGVRIAMYQGGIQPGRGLEQLIEAVPLIRPDVAVILVGDGRSKPILEHRVRDLNLCNRVKFTGKVPLDELLGYTACADVGLQILQNTCFNHYSTDSNKLFEYLSVGIPVVASDFPEIRKVVQESEVGILIDPHEPENIAEAINFVLSDKEKYDEMKRNALRASKVFNWENESEKLLEIYRRLEDEINIASN